MTSKNFWYWKEKEILLALRCLKAGMNPDLVDASLRLKSLKSRKMMSTEYITIDSLQPLVNTGILSDVLRVNKNKLGQSCAKFSIS